MIATVSARRHHDGRIWHLHGIVFCQRKEHIIGPVTCVTRKMMFFLASCMVYVILMLFLVLLAEAREVCDRFLSMGSSVEEYAIKYLFLGECMRMSVQLWLALWW